jgi:hypothetical protein
MYLFGFAIILEAYIYLGLQLWETIVVNLILKGTFLCSPPPQEIHYLQLVTQYTKIL